MTITATAVFVRTVDTVGRSSGRLTVTTNNHEESWRVDRDFWYSNRWWFERMGWSAQQVTYGSDRCEWELSRQEPREPYSSPRSEQELARPVRAWDGFGVVEMELRPANRARWLSTTVPQPSKPFSHGDGAEAVMVFRSPRRVGVAGVALEGATYVIEVMGLTGSIMTPEAAERYDLPDGIAVRDADLPQHVFRAVAARLRRQLQYRVETLGTTHRDPQSPSRGMSKELLALRPLTPAAAARRWCVLHRAEAVPGRTANFGKGTCYTPVPAAAVAQVGTTESLTVTFLDDMGQPICTVGQAGGWSYSYPVLVPTIPVHKLDWREFRPCGASSRASSVMGAATYTGGIARDVEQLREQMDTAS